MVQLDYYLIRCDRYRRPEFEGSDEKGESFGLFDMAVSASTIFKVLYYISLPFICLLKAIYWLLRILSQPIVYIGCGFVHVLAIPIRFLGRFEVCTSQYSCCTVPDLLTGLKTLFYYFGIAILVGLAVGSLFYYMYSFTSTTLGMDGESEEKAKSLATYRAEKAIKQREKVRDELFIGSPNTKGTKSGRSEFMPHPIGSPPSLLGTTILEEDDSSDDGFH